MTRNQRKSLTVYPRWREAPGRQTKSPSSPTGAARAVRGRPRPASRPQCRPCPPPAPCRCQPRVKSRPKIRGRVTSLTSLTSQWPVATRRWAAPRPSSSPGWSCWPPHQSSPPFLPPAPMTQQTPPSAPRALSLVRASCLQRGALQARPTPQLWRTLWTRWRVITPTWPGWAWRAPPRPRASPRATWSCWSHTGCTPQQPPRPGPGWGCLGPASAPPSPSWPPTPSCWRGRGLGASPALATRAPVPCPPR